MKKRLNIKLNDARQRVHRDFDIPSIKIFQKKFKIFHQKFFKISTKSRKNFQKIIQKELIMAGLSFKDQVNTKEYFSLSNIDLGMMKEHGLTMTAKALRELARRTPPAGEVFTGNGAFPQQQKLVKFWRYDYFKNVV